MDAATALDDAGLAARLVTDAAALAARMRAAGVGVTQKTSISDLVTDADHAAEELVVERLRRERPDDAILGEEGTSVEGTSGRRWVIDPVDGTYNFASGLYHWCSAVALLDGEDLVLGAVAHHASGSVLVGGPDLPTTLDGRPVARLEPAPLAQVSAATYLHPALASDPTVRDPWLRAASLPATIRMLGSGSMEMVGVARGDLGCWFQHSTPPWDWYPGAALVLGAGGSVTDLEVDGRHWYVSGRPTAVEQVAAALADARAGQQA